MQQRRGCQPQLVTLARLQPRWMELAPLTPTNRASFTADSRIRKRFVRGTNGVQRSGDWGAVECRVPGAIMPYIGICAIWSRYRSIYKQREISHQLQHVFAKQDV